MPVGSARSYIGRAYAECISVHEFRAHVEGDSGGEPLPEQTFLRRLQHVDRDSAIRELIDMHNDGTIAVDKRRFRPLAQERGLQLQ